MTTILTNGAIPPELFEESVDCRVKSKQKM
jgi:hypothetical protein